MPIYDEIRERMQGKKSKPKEKMEEEEKKAPKKKKKMSTTSAALGGLAMLDKKKQDLLMPLGSVGKKGAALGLLFDKFNK